MGKNVLTSAEVTMSDIAPVLAILEWKTGIPHTPAFIT
jgi:hypothetical protein